MAFEFRSISDMAGDVKTVLEAMTDGGEPVFKDVLVCRQTAYAELAQVIENQVATPAAAIVPGASQQAKRGARNKRETVFTLFLIGGFDSEADGAGGSIQDLADSVTAEFLPAGDTPNTQKVINNVIWEPEAWQPVSGEPHCLVAAVRLRAIDFRRER